MSRNASLVARTVSHLTSGASESAACKWAEELAAQFEGLLSASESNEAALLSAIGMAKHERIGVLRTRVLSADGEKSGVNALKSLEDRLKTDMYISPGSKEPTVADAILAWSAREVVDYVLEPADRVYEYPSSNRWLATCLTHEAFKLAYQEELVSIGVLDSDGPSRVVRGEVRVGNMIDAKPVATDARRAADKVKLINAGYKKQQTQRQKEKSAVEPTAATAATTTTSTPAAGLVPEFTLGSPISSTDPEKIEKCMKMLLAAVKVDSLEKVDHPPAMDAANLGEALASKPGIKCKNLFLKCKKPRNETDSGLQLVCCPIDRAVDLKLVQFQLGYKDQLRFASQEHLTKALDVVQGNVTPFALVNDSARTVGIVLDEEMMKNPEEILWFHPLENTASVGIPAGKLVEFIKASGRIPVILALTASASSSTGAETTEVKQQQEKAASSSPSKKSGSRGGEGAPVPSKKAPAPVDTRESSTSPTKAKAMQSSSLMSPPLTIEEALEREEKALQLVQERSTALDAAKDAVDKAKASGGDVDAAEKSFKAASRAKKEADMIYGNAAGFTEKLRSAGNTPTPIKLAEAAESSPLVFSLTHELAQDRLWARLDKLLSARPKRLEGVQHEAEDERPRGHSTHNLFVKDSKSKKLYLICLKQDRKVDLKTVGEKIGAGNLRMAGPADVEAAIALTRGCITPLSLFNNPQATVTPVFDAALLAEPNKKLVLCAGCDDPRNHPEHNCVEVSVSEMLQLINEAGAREHKTIELE